MAETWTPKDQAVYQPLRRKLLRIQAKARRDKTRKRKYSPRLPSNSSKPTKEEVCTYCGCIINDGHAYTCNRPTILRKETNAGENTK